MSNNKRPASNVASINEDLNTTSANKKQKKYFRYSDQMINSLIICLLEYKVACEYKNIDFDADKPCQYNKMREEMAKIYQDDEELFGPYPLIVIPENSSKVEKVYNDKKKLVTCGYQRVHEKLKIFNRVFPKHF
jgi:hypothetical protein